MRMWGIKPELLCKQHLLGEHAEMHMFVGTINKGTSLKGYLEKQLVDTTQIKERHDALAREMEKRGMDHKTPLKYVDRLKQGSINVSANTAELMERCDECFVNIRNDLESKSYA